MTKIQVIEHEVKKFDKASLTAFRNWFLKYDATLWDRQIEKDAHAGKLDKFAQQAIQAHKAGKTKAL